MIRAALTTAAPDARSLPNRTGSDGAPPDESFDSALADVAQHGADAAPTAAAGAVASAGPSTVLGAGQGIAALLAKLASDSTTATASKGEAGSSYGESTASKTATTDKASDATGTSGSVATDPLAAMAALLPGMVAAPIVVARNAKAQAPSDATKGSLSLGDTSVAKTNDALVSGLGAAADDAAVGVGFKLVASATHLAVRPQTAPQAVPSAAGVTTKETATTDATTATAATTAESASQDAAPVAITAHAESTISLPDGTLPSIANAIASLAADAASSPAASASSAAAPVSDPAPTSVAPARSLTLQLTPGDLGTVTVRLHLTTGGLAVDLAVDDRKTLASISHARDALASAIGDNGYRVESLVIRGPDASSTSTAGSHDSARSESEAGAGQGFSRDGAGGSGGDGSSSRQRTPQQAAAQRAPGRDRNGDGVFV